MKKLILLWLLIGCFFVSVNAQNQLSIIKSIPISARVLQVDELGNAYVVRQDNTLIKYNEMGDSLVNYMGVNNGDIGYLDVTNPLRILLYYPNFAKIILLDRMLSPKNELNLRKLNLLNSTVVAVSAEGNLWVYDQFNATLNKLDMELNYMIRGNDLRQQLSELPKPESMVERDRRVYMVDSSQGILIFDQYGSYINAISILGLSQIQVVGNQIIYFQNNQVKVYDISKIEERSLAIPQLDGQQILQALLNRSVLYVLYRNSLVLYRLSN
jgi:hypothetical protein